MGYDIDDAKNILKNLKNDPMRIIYTEHFLEQINRRNIAIELVEEFLNNENPKRITKIQNHTSRFELIYAGAGEEFFITLDLFNLNCVIMISAFSKSDEEIQRHDLLDFEGVYDLGFDLLDLHTKHCFGYGLTVEMDNAINIDFSSCGYPAAIEIIRPSKIFGLSRKYFSKAKIEGDIEISYDLIKIHLELSVDNENAKTRVFEKEVANVYKIQAENFKLKSLEIC